jgi:hypothetical protein
MSPSAPLNFDQSQKQVEGMMEQGMAFAHVEDAIDTAPLTDLHKAALWLLAWSLRDHVQQRQDARLMVTAFGVDDQQSRRSKRTQDDIVERRVGTTVVRNELRLHR